MIKFEIAEKPVATKNERGSLKLRSNGRLSIKYALVLTFNIRLIKYVNENKNINFKLPLPAEKVQLRL